MIELTLVCLSMLALASVLYMFHVIWQQMAELRRLRETDLYSRKAKELRDSAKHSHFLTDAQLKELHDILQSLKEMLNDHA